MIYKKIIAATLLNLIIGTSALNCAGAGGGGGNPISFIEHLNRIDQRLTPIDGIDQRLTSIESRLPKKIMAITNLYGIYLLLELNYGL